MKVAAICMIAGTVLFAEDGMRPRNVGDYPVHSEKNGVTIGAAVLSPEQVRNAFATNLSSGYVVVEVAVYPADGRALDLSNMDFTLKLAGTSDVVRPSSARSIAGALHRNSSGSQQRHGVVDIYPTVGIGYESGRSYDPVTGRQRNGGVYTTAGVGVGTGGGPSSAPPPASTGKDRSTMETELHEKGLPEGQVNKPVAGYLYFPLPSKKKTIAEQLDYLGDQAKVTLVLAQPAKRK
jgi:hypothetical protein